MGSAGLMEQPSHERGAETRLSCVAFVTEVCQVLENEFGVHGNHGVGMGGGVHSFPELRGSAGIDGLPAGCGDELHDR